MPMIDVYAPDDLFPAGTEQQLAGELTRALLAAEGIANPGPLHLNNTAAYLHLLPNAAIHTASTPAARTVRVQVLTPPGSLDRDGQFELVRSVTQIVARISGDPGQPARTWVLLTEAAEGGWGVAGRALGKDDFAASPA